MPVNYKLTRINDNITGNPTPRYSVTVVSQGNVNLKEIKGTIEKMSTLTKGDVQAVIHNLLTVLVEELKAGRTVTIDELGTFSLTATCRSEINEPEKVRSEVIMLKSIAFKPSPDLRKELAGVRFVKIQE